MPFLLDPTFFQEEEPMVKFYNSNFSKNNFECPKSPSAPITTFTSNIHSTQYETHLGQSLLPPGNFPFPAGLVLGTFGLKLIRQGLLSCLLSFGLVYALHQDPLVLENITLNLHVHVMVHVLVNLL